MRNGEPAIAVIGQKDFTSSARARTVDGMDVPDGLDYDDAQHRLYVTDTLQNRVLIYDVSPERLKRAMPSPGVLERPIPAIGVLGEKDFTAVSGDFSRRDQFSAPKDLIFDEDNQRLWVTDSLWERLLIFDFPRSRRGFDIPPNSMYTFLSIDDDVPGDGPQLGHALIPNVEGQGTVGGITIFSSTELVRDELVIRDSRKLVSEAAVANSALGKTAVLFVDNRGGRQTRVSLYNPGKSPADLQLTLRGPDGALLGEAQQRLEAGKRAKRVEPRIEF